MVVSSSTPSSDDAQITATRTSAREPGGLRMSGLDLIGDVPWGTHFCQFYQTKQDLIDILVPYFKAGLESNEFCMWVTSEPLGADEAEVALREAVPDLDRYLQDGQIEILPYTEWYTLGGGFDQGRVLDGWIQKLDGALARGFHGLRLTGNTFWLETSDWQNFTDYEALINSVIGNYRMIALCTYATEKCGASEVVDVVSNHEFALMKRQGKWSIVESSEHKRVEEELRSTAQRLAILSDTSAQLLVTDKPQEVVQALCRSVMDHLDCQVFFNFLADEAAGRLHLNAYAGVPSETAAEIEWLDYGVAVCGSVARDGVRMVFGNIQETPDPLTELVRSFGVQTYACHPLLSRGGRVIGTLSFGSRSRLDFDADDLSVMKTVADHVAIAMERMRLLDALAVANTELEARSRALEKANDELAASNEELSATNDDLVREIAERQRVEKALRESRSDLNRAQAVAHTGSWRLNVQQNELSWSDETHRMFGISNGTPLTYETFLAAVHPDDRELVDGAWQAGLRGEAYAVDHRIVVGEDIKWVRESAELEFDEHGELLGGFGTVQDITHYKQAEEAVRQSESKLRRLAESGVVGIAYPHTDGRISEANDEFLRMVGYTREDLYADRVRWLDMTPPECLPLDRQAQEEAKLRRSCTPYEKEYIRKDGTRVPVLVGFTRLEGSETDSIAFVLDLTERKRAEAELQRQTDILTAVASNTEAHLVYLDRDFNFIWVNQAYANACARTQEEFIGRNHFELYPHEENQAIFEHVRDTGEPYQTKEKPFLFPDHPEWGVTYWDWSLTPIKDSQGNVHSLVFSLMDVTHDMRARQEIEQLRDEAEQHASEMESFFASMTDGAALFNASGTVILANEAVERILGVPAGTPPAEWSQRYRLYAMDDELVPEEQWPSRRALRGEEFTDARYKVATEWGEVTVSESGSPVRDSEGSIVGAVIVFRDIAQQIEFERRREEVYQREHHIAEVLQKALVPAEAKCRIPGISVSTKYQPAMKEADVGGDFYDIFELGDGKLGVLIGDVVGKGLTAAIRVSAARYAVRSYALLEPDPAIVLTLANRALVTDEMDISAMLTAFFAVFDVPNRTVDYASAGHESPVVYTSEGKVIEFECFGMPLGVTEDSAYDGHQLKLNPGDMAVMVTDGITEARSPQRGFFGKDGMNAHLSSSRPASSEDAAEGLLKAALDHAGGSLHDDAAIVVVQLDSRVAHQCRSGEDR